MGSANSVSELSQEGSLKQTGIVSLEDVKGCPGFPSDEELERHPVAVIECIEEIPCDPCKSFCPFGAIELKGSVTSLPHILANKCQGCGLCIALCPGQAIFLVDKGYSEKEATVSFVHEFLPLPKNGDKVDAVNREGRTVCQATVLEVINPKKYDRSPVIKVIIPKELANKVRGIKRL